jgi:misacylated tRNA(Ala) deacylase
VTDLLYLDDAYLTEFTATVVAVDDDGRVELDRSAFYPTGGGQPHDTGTIAWDKATVAVTEVRRFSALPGTARAQDADTIWHTIDGAARPPVGTLVTGTIDWDRRHMLMRTHTAMHILCGVVWNEWGRLVTGGNMDPLSARMDFEFDPLPDGFKERLEQLANDAIADNHHIEISHLPRTVALADDDLIRTKVNLIPESVTDIRVVDIVGLDKQADGGTHVHSTREVGRLEITKVESKGKGNKRVRVTIHDA